jgi:hypothetical protein
MLKIEFYCLLLMFHEIYIFFYHNLNSLFDIFLTNFWFVFSARVTAKNTAICFIGHLNSHGLRMSYNFAYNSHQMSH